MKEAKAKVMYLMYVCIVQAVPSGQVKSSEALVRLGLPAYLGQMCKSENKRGVDSRG